MLFLLFLANLPFKEKNNFIETIISSGHIVFSANIPSTQL